MIAYHVHQALAHVRELKSKIIDQQRFKGYSGIARMTGGALAAATAWALWSPLFPDTMEAHFLGWTVLFILAIMVNYGALARWFLFDPEVGRDIRRLNPAFDLFPTIFVGGVLTFVFARHGLHSLLFGTWMSLFGIMNLISSRLLPRKIARVGIFYISVGTVLLVTAPPFTDPWPMGLTFCIGELTGGYIMETEND